MTARKYQNGIATDAVISLLDRLIDQSTQPPDYAQALYDLGQILGKLLKERFRHSSSVTLACTVEDADHLGRGILDSLEHNDSKVYLTVFWNKRFEAGGLSIAPIVKQYREEGVLQTKTLVIIKSIISSSCVVRTNLTHLIEEFSPEQILVVAPVLLNDSIAKLESEFDPAVSEKFEYLYFAEDSDRTDDGTVLPGIGGNIYQRLGFSGQEEKNRFVPAIVKERREQLPT